MNSSSIDESVIAEIKARIKPSDLIGQYVNLRRSGKEYIGLSPFGKEKTPSFTVCDDKGFFHDFSSGKHGDIIDFLVEAKGMKFRDAVERLAKDAGVDLNPAAPKPKPTIVCHYVYQNQSGEPHLRVTRLSDKSFRQAHWAMVDDISEIWGWKSGKHPGAVIPYRLPELLANPDQTIHLVEGEKSADHLRSLGLVATTAPGGGPNFPISDDFSVWFDGQRVRAYPDNDAAGEKWAERVAMVIPHAEIVRLPNQPPKAGADDWLQAGRSVDDLLSAPASSEPSAEAGKSSLKPTQFQWVEPSSIPQREVLYGTHLYRKFVSVTVSPGGVGKSSLVMMEAVCMASNQPKLGEPIYGGPFRVWYWNGEDPQDENIRRVVAAAVHHKIKPDEFSSRLWIDSGRDMQIKLAAMARGEIELNDALFDQIEEALIERSIDVLIIDPLVSAHLVSENDNGAIDAIIKRLGRVAERARCAIELVHHVRKPASADAKVDVHDARGAGALIAGVRSARILNGMTEEEAKESGVNPNDRFSYFQVDLGKSNLSKRDGRSKWRRVVGVGLGNHSDIRDEDVIGVVEVYDKPAANDGFPEDAAVQAQRLAESRDTYRHWNGSGPPPGDWYGFAVARLFGMDEEKDKKPIRRMIGTWLKSGVLTTREAINEQKNHVVYIASTRTAIEPTLEPTPEVGDEPF